MIIEVKSLNECTDEDISGFYEIVAKGGTVSIIGLKDRIIEAKALAFLKNKGNILGIKALKYPKTNYKKNCFKNAKIPESESNYVLELGWTYIKEEARSLGWNSKMTKELKASKLWEASFATVLEDNFKVHTSLKNMGFRQVGEPWQASLVPDKQLIMFVCDH